MGEILPFSTGRVFWHMDTCPLPIADNTIVDEVLPSVLSLVRSHGFDKVALQSHYNTARYFLPTDRIWLLGQCNIEVCRHRKEPVWEGAQATISRKISAGYLSTSLPRPIFLISGDENLSLGLHRMLGKDLVICTSLVPQYSMGLREMVTNGASVYTWKASSGIGKQYQLTDL